MAKTHGYSAGKFVLQIEGSDAGYLLAVEGGHPFGVVVDEAPDGKRLAGVSYAPIVLDVGASMDPALHEWVAAMLDGTQKAASGAILLLDYDYRERSRIDWKEAVITEVEFPGADASVKDPPRVRVTIQPQSTRTAVGSGAKYQPKSTGKPTAKGSAGSAFRFTVSGLELACIKVAEVAPFAVRHGRERDVADVVFWLAESEAAPFVQWFDDFVINGNNSAGQERTATLSFLGHSLTQELLRIDFRGLGIFRVSHERREAGLDRVSRVKVEMYCQSVRLEPTGDVTPAPQAPAWSAAGQTAATVESFAAAFVAALRPGSGSPPPTQDAVVERLLSSVDPQPRADERERGRAAGRAWAAERARLDELEELAQVVQRDEWTTLALAEGHSLIGFLAAAGELAADEIGPIELKRDGFTSSLAAGAAELYQSVADRLGDRRPPKS